MISQFSVKNYRSIREEQTVSFLSSSDKTLRDLISVEVAKGVYINKLAIFFGANASGKSNILFALGSLFMIMSTPTPNKKSSIKQYIPFEQNKESPTWMKIEFYIQGVKYYYEITFNGSYVENESLSYVPSRSKALIYSRRYVGEDSQPDITFGRSLHFNLKTKESLKESTFNNHSVLSTVYKLSLGDDAKTLQRVFDWVVRQVHCKTDEESPHSYASDLKKLNSNNIKKALYLKLLAKADFNIVDFRLIDNKASLSKDLVNSILNDSNITEEQQIVLLNKVVFTNHSQNGDFEIPLELQSEGTLRFIELMDVLYNLVMGDHIYLLDELGNKMHYDLIVYYLTLFLYNSEASQLFFTTQSILLLDEEFIRRDMVYLAEKDIETASTEYVRVSDMGLHKKLSLYNAYRLGKLGSRPELGSPYLNLPKK